MKPDTSGTRIPIARPPSRVFRPCAKKPKQTKDKWWHTKFQKNKEGHSHPSLSRLPFYPCAITNRWVNEFLPYFVNYHQRLRVGLTTSEEPKILKEWLHLLARILPMHILIRLNAEMKKIRAGPPPPPQ